MIGTREQKLIAILTKSQLQVLETMHKIVFMTFNPTSIRFPDSIFCNIYLGYMGYRCTDVQIADILHLGDIHTTIRYLDILKIIKEIKQNESNI